jgi:lysozyme family protein/peptidoglycan hydrolase-like protein with peptidoglycan-binding domain
MSLQLARRAPDPALGGTPPASAAPATASPDTSNSEVLSLVTDASVDEEPASVLLDLALPETGDTSWAAPLDAYATPAVAATPAPTPAKRPSGELGAVWDDNRRDVARMDLTLSRTQKAELEVFREKYEANAERYERVAERTGVPAMLIAALHYRESSMNFGTYLHQGDPLGKPAVHVPRDIPVFDDWEDAAVHALGLKSSIRDEVGLTADSRDGAAMATFAEAYNGLGYHHRGLASPDVFAGSDRYTGGMYVADGKFSSTTFDRRLGVATILQAMGALDPSKALPPGGAAAGDDWQEVLAGDRVVRQSQRGDAVVAMQERLAAAGYRIETDGVYGRDTAAAVRRFQADHGLEVDGVIGVATAAALQRASKTQATPAPSPAPVAPKTLAPSPRDVAWTAVSGGQQVLERGSSGEAVRALQERLRARGYAIRIDGEFGPATRAAVYDLQAELGVRVDGGVGPETAAALDAVLGR